MQTVFKVYQVLIRCLCSSTLYLKVQIVIRVIVLLLIAVLVASRTHLVPIRIGVFTKFFMVVSLTFHVRVRHAIAGDPWNFGAPVLEVLLFGVLEAAGVAMSHDHIELLVFI